MQDSRMQVRSIGCFVALIALGVTALAACAPGAPQVTPTATLAPAKMYWWNDAVFYEVFVRSFADSTTGPLAGDGVGDLQGLIERLDYLNDGDPATTDDLGVTGLWLMPIMQSPSYHGYDVTDYYKVDDEYGDNEDFKRLMAEAHKRGIRVIIDLVLNHTSSEHPWFVEASKPGSAYRDWYIWSETNPGYLGPWNQQVWHQLGDKYYYGMFWSGMPDLNYRTPAVTEEMLKITRYWLQDMGADGYRLDAIRHLIEEGQVQENTPATHEWLRQFNQVYKAANPQAVSVGEVWSDSGSVASYIGDQLDLAFEFELSRAILASVNNSSAAPVAALYATDLKVFSPGQYATFITNHDQERTMSYLFGDTGRAKLAATVLLTGPGVPFIYYGEELGMTGQKPDEMIRTPMQWTPGQHAGFSTHTPWGPLNQGYEQVNVQTQAADPNSLLNHYRKLIALRNTHEALRLGDTLPVKATSEVYAFLRQTEQEKLLVVINFGGKPASDYGLSVEASRLSGQLKAVELLGGAQVAAPKLDAQGGFSDYTPIPELAPRTGYIIQLAP